MLRPALRMTQLASESTARGSADAISEKAARVDGAVGLEGPEKQKGRPRERPPLL
jgi:hypothetical protein